MTAQGRFLSIVLVAIAGTLLLRTSAGQSNSDSSLPPDSVYQLEVSIEDQVGEISGLDRYRGNPVIVTMFYASCPHVCPMLVSTIKLTESKLTSDERAELRVLTISIDPERDTPEKLHETLERHAVDADRWSMSRSTPGDLRALAGVFGVKYKQLPDGEFNHTTRMILLDQEGVQVATSDQLGRYDPAFLEAIKTTIAYRPK
jgi:protein SCO1/2